MRCHVGLGLQKESFHSCERGKGPIENLPIVLQPRTSVENSTQHIRDETLTTSVDITCSPLEIEYDIDLTDVDCNEEAGAELRPGLSLVPSKSINPTEFQGIRFRNVLHMNT